MIDSSRSELLNNLKTEAYVKKLTPNRCGNPDCEEACVSRKFGRKVTRSSELHPLSWYSSSIQGSSFVHWAGEMFATLELLIYNVPRNSHRTEQH